LIDLTQLNDILEKAPETSITVFGDYCLDKYLYIEPDLDEPSVETGLTAYQVTRKGIYAGVAGTVANALLALTAKVLCVGVVGDDGEGYELVRELNKRGADTSLMVTETERCTCTYTKPMRRNGDVYSEMNRLDFRNRIPMSHDVEAELIARLREAAARSKALIVLDQFPEPNVGTVTDNMRDEVAKIAAENPDLIVYADSRAFISKFRNVIVKCNNFEIVRAVEPGYTGKPDRETVLRCAHILHERNGKPVFVTLGGDGIAVLESGRLAVIPGIEVTGPIDTCGAGDTASSGIVLGLSSGAGLVESAFLGNIVASITIQQIGVTGTATPAQVLERYNSISDSF
jgi:rfaE bifunctional protein kinase chain/domain